MKLNVAALTLTLDELFAFVSVAALCYRSATSGLPAGGSTSLYHPFSPSIQDGAHHQHLWPGGGLSFNFISFLVEEVKHTKRAFRRTDLGNE